MRKILFASFAIFFFAIFTCRVLILSIPFFTNEVASSLLLNLLSGLSSDLVVLSFFFLCLVIISLIKNRLVFLGLSILYFLFSLIWVVTMAMTIRYVEHFGMTLRLYHISHLMVGEVWSAGTGMVLESWRAVLMLVVPFFLTGMVWSFFGGHFIKISELNIRATMFLLIGALGFGVLANATNIQLVVLPPVNIELRYNPIIAAYNNYKKDEKLLNLGVVRPDELVKVRDILGQRDYDNSETKSFPLWQKSLKRSISPNQIFESLLGHIKHQQRLNGPMNVVIILEESLRAFELDSFQGKKANLMPEVSGLRQKGISFSQFFSAGIGTHYGQSAVHCSLYGVREISILAFAPLARANCLGDIFSARGYETHFFYGAENHFDNQQSHYSSHNFSRIHGGNDFPRNSPKGGWGVSDRELFQYAAKSLSVLKKPFFAQVLTLSYHGPFKLPDDHFHYRIDRSFSVQDQLLQYVDFSLGEFVREMQQNKPNTMIVITADHGNFFDFPVAESVPSFKDLRKVARIPLIIIVPGIESGNQISRLASSVDIGPTILSLLDWSDTPNQFMGANAFTRTQPIFLAWKDRFIKVTDKNGGDYEVSDQTEPYAKLIISLLMNNQLKPELDLNQQ